ncbi:MAG: hypothetical protein AAF968_06430 [Pseudomonadota bacterium]
MGRPSRDKGARRERELVRRLKDSGIHAERVPLSGAAGGTFSGDVDVYASGHDAPFVAELKARKNGEGFKTLEGWLGDLDMLVLWRDRATPFYVVPERVMRALLSGKPMGDAE